MKFFDHLNEGKQKGVSEEEAETIMAKLLDKGINSIVDGDTITVDKENVNKVKQIIKKLGYDFLKVKVFK